MFRFRFTPLGVSCITEVIMRELELWDAYEDGSITEDAEISFKTAMISRAIRELIIRKINEKN